jgi:glucose-6-phosphate isomerase
MISTTPSVAIHSLELGATPARPCLIVFDKMKPTPQTSWQRFQEYYKEFPTIGLALDLSRMNLEPAFFKKMEPRMQKSFAAMAALEKGAIANPDEGRMVGHYWLRNPAKAPTVKIRREIETTIARIKTFAKSVHQGKIRGQGGKFQNMLIVGIGGSALGPQFVSNALSNPSKDKIKPFFLDNTDPDGIQRVLASIGNGLNQTICIVISKSGGTKETRNGMLEVKVAYQASGLKFEKHAVAITGEGSELDKFSLANGWIERFPMWDWVGGRTSELSAVGLLPAAIQGFDIDSLLLGAKACDELTRIPKTGMNPAALLALAWHHAGNGRGDKNMVVIPYKDRLELLSKYLQQLIMESLGKEKDLAGKVVNQGITVLGNKGSTDQHSYIQQLRDGLSDFFLTFVEVLVDQKGKALDVEAGFTSGDYLSGFMLGTRQAMQENNRETLTIIVKEVNPATVGVLIALYERAVGLYASLVGINAYHQPGVESGKKAATRVLNIQRAVLDALKVRRRQAFTVKQIAEMIPDRNEAEHVFKILERLSSNPGRGVKKYPGKSPFAAKYSTV